ncbi:NTP pyrophosphohydrolase including oxidative damage repair enzyme [Candidatus Terasakiella magnetica]|nr:NTP pyrophosphohydrolase including oxidative damage repair enzyme [Candidatus Terasakiella magnetica]
MASHSTRRADYRRYRQLMAARPDLFSFAADGIQILSDEAEIKTAQRHIARRNREIGLPPASASIGVLAEDRYILALRDAIRFPDGSLGTHNRVIYVGAEGVGVLALFEGDIIAIRIYRHPLRRWLLEIPRGTVEPGDSLEDTVRKEVSEEIGGTVTRLVHLGGTVSDSSLSSGGVELFYAELSQIGGPDPSEGIGALIRISPADFMDKVCAGEFTDSHGIAAFSLARFKGLL